MTIVLALWLLIFGHGSACPEVEAEVLVRDGSMDFASGEAQYQCRKALHAQCAAVGLGPATGARVYNPACFVGFDDVARCSTECSGVCDPPSSE